jgi:hypothetical protein
VSAAWSEDAQGRPILDLRAEGALNRPALDDLPELTPDERAMAVRTWRGRMVNEHASAQVFAGLVPQLMRAALPGALQAEVPSMIADEYRHARQCAGVVLALGGDPVAPLPTIQPLPDHADVSPLEAVLRNVISVGCLSETVAVSVIRAEHAELEGSTLGGVLATILADEVQHARFGWKLLGMLAPRLDADARARTSRYLVDALRHQIAWEVPKLPVNLGLRAELAMAGVCDGAQARELFFATIGEVVVPQLEAAGLDGRAAWAAAQA